MDSGKKRRQRLMKKKAKRIIDKTPKDMVTITDLEIGDIVTFLTVDFDPDADKIESFDCGVVDVVNNAFGKVKIRTAKGDHVWHSPGYKYERINKASRSFSHDSQLAPKPISVTVRGISIE
jgi:hypothetical protein